MDFPSPFLRTPAASPAASLFVPRFSISSWNRNSPRTLRIPSSRFGRAASPPLCLPFSHARHRPVAALSGRRAKRRRNHLREKLLHDRKVRPDFTQWGPESDAQAPSFDGVLENGAFVESGSRKNVPFDCGDEVAGLVESKRRALGESVLWSRLENWVDQYKNDLDLWGVGSAPIFTVFQDADGNVKRVSVDEDEILRRSRVVLMDSNEVNSKIARARGLAREMESGSNVIPRNSSVAKFVVMGAESGLVSTARNLTLHSSLRPKVLGAGTMILCVVFVLSTIKWFFTLYNKREVQHTQLEKEMMRRKMKARKEKEKEKGHLEIVREASETPNVQMQRPHLDKHALAASIRQGKTSNSELPEPKEDCSNRADGLAVGFHGKIKEIREMAKRARETEGRESSLIEGYEGEKQGKESLSIVRDLIKQHDEDGVSSPVNHHAHAGGGTPANESHVISTAEPERNHDGSHGESLTERNGDVGASSISSMGDYSDTGSCRQDKATKCISDLTNAREIQSLDAFVGEVHAENGVRRKPKIIRSVKEARQYLSDKFGIQEGNEDVKDKDLGDSEINSNSREMTNIGEQSARVGMSGEKPDSLVNANVRGDMIAKELESIPEVGENSASHVEEHGAYDVHNPLAFQKYEANGSTAEADTSKKSQNWIEENFNVVEPILGKIGDGFRNNYMIAREKVNQPLNANIDLSQLHPDEDNGELEWMKDDNLREIVFQVRENELTGKDPFYSMDTEDKHAFFAGLEKKVEKVNEELLKVHKYLHSNIENLDYGADGISIYDPVEKIIPRWKEPPVEREPDFVNGLKAKKASMTGEAQVSPLMKKDENNSVEKSAESQGNDDTASSLAVNSVDNIHSKDPKKTRILIEGSDGSVRTGKKSGKEYWQHTKKWSRGFLDSYNAERDPEVKSVMKDIGKDLDRWITEEEIQEAAELMDKLPERNKEYIGKKLNKLKREMELFGPQAVVSKYREYAEDKDQDYLWWLDLPHVLCIELYTHQGGEQKVGFYSLEMAADLELEPKPHHVIAFEDAGDCKNLCYIIQAHMEMLGNGQAFIVPLPPKDAFREAKANGFGVTVVRKGEIQLNVDQPLEEVEEQIAEIGSEIYHNKIMQERSVDIGALMKGMLGVNSKPSKRRRLKRARKKPSRNRKTK